MQLKQYLSAQQIMKGWKENSGKEDNNEGNKETGR